MCCRLGCEERRYSFHSIFDFLRSYEAIIPNISSLPRIKSMFLLPKTCTIYYLNVKGTGIDVGYGRP